MAEGEEKNQNKIVYMIMGYIGRYFSEYSDYANYIIELILQIVNISDPEEKYSEK
jgi:hypothetical protein